MAEDHKTMFEELNEILQNSSEEEKKIIQLALQAIRQNRKDGSSYISSFLGLMGELIDECTYQYITPTTPFMLNPLGMVHGGITATIADTTMGTLVNKILPDRQVCVTSEIKVNYISPGVGEKLISQAKLLHRGRNLCYCECKVTNEKGKLIIATSGSFFISEKSSLARQNYFV
jgi:uncharacterized protein (TIGR00369 family)